MKTVLVAVAAALALTAVRAEALPDFDAATITGDELVGLLTNRTAQLTKEDYRTLGAALKGRELTFHGFCANGCGDGSDRGYSLLLTTATESFGRLMPDERFHVEMRFSDKNDVRFAQRVYGSGSCVAIREFSGVVIDGCKSYDGSLALDATVLEPTVPIEDLPDFDAQTVTGDALAELCKKLKGGVTQNAYEDLNALLLDRELTFNDVQVIESIEREDGYTDLSCSVGSFLALATSYPKSICLCLVARLRTKDVDALPWGFSNGMRIKRLTGRVTEPFRSTEHRRLEGLPLADAKVDVAWKDEKLPEFDAATLTGDQLVELVTSFDDECRFAKLQRICRALRGRRLTFGEGIVRKCHSPWRKKDIIVDLGFGPKRNKFNFVCPPVEALFPAGEAAETAAQLTNGQKLRNVSGVFALSELPKGYCQNENGVGRWYQLTEVAFDAPAAQPLPPFDEKAVTGDELAKLMIDREDGLTLAQQAELQTRLAGRRLTFHKACRSGASGGMGGWTTVTFRFYRMNMADKPRVFNVVANLRDPEPMEESRKARRRGACWTVEGTVDQPKDLGTGADFALTDAVIKWEPTDNQ